MIRYIDDIRKAETPSEEVMYNLRKATLPLHSYSITPEEGKELLNFLDTVRVNIRIHIKEPHQYIQKDEFEIE